MSDDLTNSRALIRWIAFASFVGVVLAAADGRGLTFRSWIAYTVLTAFSTLLIYLVWKAVEGESTPRWLFSVALVGFVLRLGVGLALYRAIPIFGYGEMAERAGYVYWDAFKRDKDAYDRGRGDVPLVVAFSDPKRSDQYGGLLFVSAAIYRYIGTEEHRPILPVTLLAGVSSLAVLFSWGVGKRLFNDNVASGAAWISALYPEAVLLGASQMREPFLISAFAAGLYGYLIAREGTYTKGFMWILIAIVFFTLPISPPFMVVLLLTMLLAWLWESRKISLRTLALVLLGLLVVTIAVFLAVRAWAGLEEIEGTTFEVIDSWIGNAVAGWRITRVAEQSVWLDTLLTDMPEGLQLPFLVVFGLVQPFLPAALVAPGSVLWKSIAIWRSMGWFLIIPLLMYGTTATIRRLGWKHLGSFLGIFIWISALLASYRAPSYQWDNPRYRAVFLAVQAVIAAWAWWYGRHKADRWLQHIIILFAGNTAIFTYWYLGRYTGLPKLALLHNLLLIGLFTTLYLVYALMSPKLRTSAGLNEEKDLKEV